KLSLSALSLALLSGCPSPPRAPPPPQAVSPTTAAAPAAHVGTPYQIVSQSSLLTVLVYRGGALASAGHNHVIASHDLTGALYIPSDILQSSFEVHVPVATLTVDEAELRAQQPVAEFPPDVPDSAKEGTRRNMLGEALLDAQSNPEIVLRSLRLEPANDKATDPPGVLASVQSSVRGQLRTFTVPVRYRFRTAGGNGGAGENGGAGANGIVEASGDFALRQTDLGLTPFSAMLGALQVQDEMRISFRIVAQAAAVKR
ncbi:MAG TPA: YceI family protein, partial [Steroidobacteraceae bacterium]|nr:YceI family protein [Steroidobacteraceae bacterium]